MPLKRTPLKRVSKDRLAKIEERREQSNKDNQFFLEIWREREHKCESCGNFLNKEISKAFFDHLLEKEMYEDLRYEKKNIMLVCIQCHGDKGMGHPTEIHRARIEEAKRIFDK